MKKVEDIINDYLEVEENAEYPIFTLKSAVEQASITLMISDETKNFANERGISYVNGNIEEALDALSKEKFIAEMEATLALKKLTIIKNEIGFIETVKKYNEENEKIVEAVKALRKKNTINKWIVPEDFGTKCERIENETYSFWISYEPDKSWLSQKSRFRIRYSLLPSSVLPKSDTITSIDKFVDDEETALKYIEGRKKAFEKFFKEDRPPMLKEYSRLIQTYGLSVPFKGYRIEE